MTILSVNPLLELHLLNDNSFLFSHLRGVMTALSPDDVSGKAIASELIGNRLELYEEIGGRYSLSILALTAKALDNLFKNPELLANRKSLQTVLKVGDSVNQPLLGLPALIVLNELVSLDVASNVICEFEDTDDINDLIEVPTYLSCLPYDFCVNMSDSAIDFNSEGDTATELVCLAVNYQARLTDDVDTSFSTDVRSASWVYKLIRHYEQAKFELTYATQMAASRPNAFALICAAILGISFDKVQHYSATDSYENLNDTQRYEFLMTIKPLVEQIGFDFINNNLPDI